MFVHVGNQPFNAKEGDCLVLMNQIANQEARPGIARTRIGSEEHIIRKNCDVPLNSEFAKKYVADARKVFESPFQHSFASDFAAALVESLDPDWRRLDSYLNKGCEERASSPVTKDFAAKHRPNPFHRSPVTFGGSAPILETVVFSRT